MMQFTYLMHDKRLCYSQANRLRPLPENVQARYDCDRLVSFRCLPGRRKPDHTVKKLHAAMRPLGIYNGNSICFYGVQSDSPLAPLLLWDAVHFMEIGQKIALVEDTPMPSYLDREYFSRGLKRVHGEDNVAVYEKFATLPAEGDDDLDHWTFGIPVGPEDATVLNAVVKRILELDIPHKEILLCGRPGENFAYFDQVRIVGEDIPAPPVQICKKKNRLAEEAKYNNLVILHDRVFLPRHFGEMVRRFGPRYPLVSMQSLYFDNRLCMHPRRYSDFGIKFGELSHGLTGLHRHSGKASSIAPAMFSELEHVGFGFANPMRYHLDSSYVTGSMCISRKEVWNMFPQDEALLWIEFEDIEHSLRASEGGVPCRVNPHGISQTITSRPLLNGAVPVENINGKITQREPKYLSFFAKKPLFKISQEIAWRKLRKFSEKYISKPLDLLIPVGEREISPIAWISLLNLLVQQASFPNTSSAVKEFINDYEKMLIFDQIPYGTKEAILGSFQENHLGAKRDLIFRNAVLLQNMLYQRPLRSWFCMDIHDYFHSCAYSWPGILFSAAKLCIKNGDFFYFKSIFSAIRCIYNSTPFESYLRKSQ